MAYQDNELYRAVGCGDKRVGDLIGFTRALPLLMVPRWCCRVDPILPEARKDTKLYQMFFVLFSANFNVLGCVPAFFLRRSSCHQLVQLGLAPVHLAPRFSVSGCEIPS